MTTTLDQPTLNFDQIEGAVRMIAATFPEKVYKNPQKGSGPRCAYMHGDDAGCIFGHVFLALGVPAESLTLCDTRASGVSASRVARDNGVTLTSQQQWWADCVQNQQDSGSTWAHSVAYADRSYPLR